jgi:hypothetical protein
LHCWIGLLLVALTACQSPVPFASRSPEYARTGQELLAYEQQNFAYR